MNLFCRPLIRRRLGLVLAALAMSAASGCASLTNPVADGIPVSRLPDEVFGESREGFKQVPLNLLGQEPPEVYRLAPGDVLGVVIEGVLGEKNAPPPIHLDTTEKSGTLPALGYPILIQEDGTITVPFVEPVKVGGLTLNEARDALLYAYTKKKEILKADTARIIVSLMRPRRYHVQVFREDGGTAGVPAGPGLGNGIGASLVGASRKGTASSVELPAYENDVLNALNRSGGLPGTDAKNEVIVQRTPRRGGLPPEVIRIPLRLRAGEPIPFRPEDIVLQSGDTVFVEARNQEVFYTAGLLGSGQYPLPRDNDLDVIQAIATVRGPLINGGFSQGAFGGSSQSGGIGGPNPSQVTVVRQAGALGQISIRVDLNKAFRDRRERIRLLPGDILVLQTTSEEAITQYLIQAFRFGASAPVIRAGDLQTTGSSSFP